jgi:hypothetical protein
MRHVLLIALLPSLAATVACGVDERTGPAAPPTALPQLSLATLATINSAATVDDPGKVGTFTSLVSISGGAQHIAYLDETDNRLKYARCTANCTNGAGWQKVTVDAGGRTNDVGRYSSLTVGGDGRVHVSYYDATAGRLKYATCAASCLLSNSWQRQSVDGGCNIV